MEQSDPNQARLQTIDDAALKPIVLKTLDRQQCKLLDWNYKRIHGGVGGGQGGTFVYRFQGAATVQGQAAQWSVILKIIHARPDQSPQNTHYWRREAEAYRTGLLQNLPGSVAAARAYDVVEYEDEGCWIWQEDVKENFRDPWEPEQYRMVARHFGQFNGAYIDRYALPDEPWLATRWLRKIAMAAKPYLPQIVAMLKDPLLRPAFPPRADVLFLELWDERERFLGALDRLPQVFAHQDPVRRNLFLRCDGDGNYETVAVDWAYVGQAALGMDIAVPFNINLAFMDIDIGAAQQLERALYEGYLQGLRDAGWDGDAQLVRLGFTAGAACKYIEAMMLTAVVAQLTNPARHSDFERMTGHPIQDVIQQSGGIFHYMMSLADEARQIMDDTHYAD